jgi:L-threonylcarbamoyladenylate synthase
MKTKVLSIKDTHALRHAKDVLCNGGVVAFPTDTVYGLGAAIFSKEGIDRLYTIKGRHHTKAIAVLLSSIEKLHKVTPSPGEIAERLANEFWPGPLTLILPRNPKILKALSPLPTIGVRVPNHKVALELLRLSGPLGVTSANLSGLENTTTAREVLDQLDGRVHLVLDGGRTPGGRPSTVVDCTTPEPTILREGPITKTQIITALKQK